MQLSASAPPPPPPEEQEGPGRKNDGDVGDASMREKEKGDPEMELALPLSSLCKVPTAASSLALKDVKLRGTLIKLSKQWSLAFSFIIEFAPDSVTYHHNVLVKVVRKRCGKEADNLDLNKKRQTTNRPQIDPLLRLTPDSKGP